MIRQGSKVRVLKTEGSCCGVIQQGWTGSVREIIENLVLPSNILVLDDDTLVWEHNVQETI